jgi:hypothetical protein
MKSIAALLILLGIATTANAAAGLHVQHLQNNVQASSAFNTFSAGTCTAATCIEQLAGKYDSRSQDAKYALVEGKQETKEAAVTAAANNAYSTTTNSCTCGTCTDNNAATAYFADYMYTAAELADVITESATKEAAKKRIEESMHATAPAALILQTDHTTSKMVSQKKK